MTGGQLVVVSGTSLVAPSSVATHTWLGVAGYDAPLGDDITVFMESKQRVTATGAITARQNVEAAANGTVAAHTNGTNDQNIVGLAMTTAANGGLVEVALLR